MLIKSKKSTGSLKKLFQRVILVSLSFYFVSCGFRKYTDSTSGDMKTNVEDYSSETVGVKWHPGHYLALPGGIDESVDSYFVKEAYNDMNNTKGIEGLQLRFRWSDLEKTKDVYDFSIIENHLTKVSTTGNKLKRIFIILDTKSFDADKVNREPLVPDYITNINNVSLYDGGTFRYGSYNDTSLMKYHGDGIKFWNDAVRDRFTLLIKRLGEKFNSHTHFEGVCISETAMGVPLDPISEDTEKKYFDALLHFNKNLRLAFPNTITSQLINYPRVILADFTNKLESMGSAIGGPDIFIEDPALTTLGDQYNPPGAYSYYPKLSGSVAITPSVMTQNYTNTYLGSTTNRIPEIRELLNFGRDNLKGTHIFWTRDAGGYYKQALKLINNLTINNDPAVQLNSQCPTAYKNCITD